MASYVLMQRGFDVKISGTGWFSFVAPNLRGVTWTDRAGEVVFEADEVEINPSILSLLRGRLHLQEVQIEEGRLVLHDRPNGGWGLGIEPSGGTSTASSKWTLAIDRLAINEATIHVLSRGVGPKGSEWADTVAAWSELTGGVDDLIVRPGGEVEGRIRVVESELRLGIAPQDYRLEIDGRGSFVSPGMRLDSVRIDGSASTIVGGLTMGWQPLSATGAPTLDGRFETTALAASDIVAFAPAYKGSLPWAAGVDLEGTADSLHMTVEGSPRSYGRLQGTVVVFNDVPRRLRWGLEIDSLDTKALAGDEATGGFFAGRTDGHVAGDRPSEWTGSLELVARPSRLGDLAVASGSSALQFRAGIGAGAFALNLVDAGGSTQVSGTAEVDPFALRPRLSSTSTIRRDWKALGPRASAWVGSLELAVAGVNADDFDLEARLSVAEGDPLAVGRSAIHGVVDVVLTNGHGRWSTALAAGEARFDGRGAVALDSLSVRTDQSTLTWSDLDVAALLGDTLSSSVSGRARLALEMPFGGRVQSSGSARVAGANYGQAGIDSMLVSWQTERRMVASRVDAWAGSGSGYARLRARPYEQVPQVDVTEAELRGVDLGALLPRSNRVATQLDALFTGSWSGTAPRTASARLDWTMLPSRIQALDSVAGGGAVILEAGRVSLAGSASSPNLGLGVDAWLDPLSESQEWALTSLAFSGVDASDLMPDAVPTDLNGTVVGKGTGLMPSTLLGELTLRFDSSRVGGIEVRRADLNLTGREGLFGVQATSEFAGSSIDVHGEMDLYAPVPRYSMALSGRGSGDLLLTDSARFGQWNARMDGSGATLDSLVATVVIEGDSADVFGVAVERMRIFANAGNGQLRVDTAVLEGPGVQLRGEGVIALSARGHHDARLTVDLESFETVRPFVSTRPLGIGKATGTVWLTGPPEDASLHLSASSNALLIDNMQLVGFEGSGTVALDGIASTAWQGELNFRDLIMPRLSVSDTRVSGAWDGSEATIGIAAVVDERRSVDVAMVAQTGPEGRALRIDDIAASIDADVWRLERVATLTTSDGAFRIDSLDLRAAGQRLLMFGSVGRTGPQAFLLEANEVEIGTMADLIGWDGLTGRVSGAMELAGTSTLPVLNARWRAELSAPGARATLIRSGVAFEDGRATLDLELLQADNPTVVGEASLPLHLTLPWSGASGDALVRSGAGPVTAELRGDSLTFTWLRPFLTPLGFEDVAGTAGFDISVEGTMSDPRVSGVAGLKDGRVRIPALGTEWERAGLSMDLREQTLAIDSFRVESGSGTLQAAGTIELTDLTVGNMDVELTANAFEAIDNNLAHAEVTGSARLRGTTWNPEVTGNLQLLSTDIHLGGIQGGSVQDVVLDEEDYRQLEQTFGRSFRAKEARRPALADSLSLNLNIEVGRDTWIRQSVNPQLAIQMAGEVRVEKQPRDSLRIIGEIEAIPERSFVEQFGRRFSVSEGRLSFQGLPRETRIDLAATYSVPSVRDPDQAEVTIDLGVTGTAERFDIVLGSSPSMDNSDIVSYLATGRPASEDLGLQGTGSFGDLGSDIAVGAVASAIEGAAAERVGLDVVDIQMNGPDGATLVAGRYVSPRLFVGVRQPLSLANSSDGNLDPGSEVEIEYQALRWLLLNLEAGGRGFDFIARSRVSY